MIGTTKAASLLGISTSRVHQLLSAGRIEGAVKKGNFWQIPLGKNGLPTVSIGKRGPEATWSKVSKLPVTRIHINQHKIRSNIRAKNPEPVISIAQSKGTTYCDYVKITGTCEIFYSPDKPLSGCGARVWIELDKYASFETILK